MKNILCNITVFTLITNAANCLSGHENFYYNADAVNKIISDSAKRRQSPTQNEFIAYKTKALQEDGITIAESQRLEDQFLSYIYAMNTTKIIAYLRRYSFLARMTYHNNATMLHFAVRYNAYDLLDILFNRGVSIDAQDYQGCTPLQLAVCFNREHMITRLVQLGADINTIDLQGMTPLHRSVMHNNLAMTNTLINNGARTNTINLFGCTPLHIAAYNGYTQVAELLIRHNPELMDMADVRCITPLHLAMIGGYIDMVRLMISRHKNETTLSILRLAKQMLYQRTLPNCEQTLVLSQEHTQHLTSLIAALEDDVFQSQAHNNDFLLAPACSPFRFDADDLSMEFPPLDSDISDPALFTAAFNDEPHDDTSSIPTFEQTSNESQQPLPVAIIDSTQTQQPASRTMHLPQLADTVRAPHVLSTPHTTSIHPTSTAQFVYITPSHLQNSNKSESCDTLLTDVRHKQQAECFYREIEELAKVPSTELEMRQHASTKEIQTLQVRQKKLRTAHKQRRSSPTQPNVMPNECSTPNPYVKIYEYIPNKKPKL